jgi:hypothetical protein
LICTVSLLKIFFSSFRALILFCLFSTGAVANATHDERLFDNPLSRSASHAERSSMYYMFCRVFYLVFLSPFLLVFIIICFFGFCLFIFLLVGHKAASLEKMKCNLNDSFDHISLTQQGRSHVSAPHVFKSPRCSPQQSKRITITQIADDHSSEDVSPPRSKRRTDSKCAEVYMIIIIFLFVVFYFLF